MATQETKLKLAKEMAEVIFSNVRSGVITPAEASEICRILSECVDMTNDIFKEKGDEGLAFVEFGESALGKGKGEA